MMGVGYKGKRAMQYDRDEEFYRRANWEEKFTLLPQRCALSNYRIWLKKGFIGTAIWTGPGLPVYEYKWHDAKEHTMWLLKQ